MGYRAIERTSCAHIVTTGFAADVAAPIIVVFPAEFVVDPSSAHFQPINSPILPLFASRRADVEIAERFRVSRILGEFVGRS